MEIELSQRQIDAIAYKLAVILESRLRQKVEAPELLTTEQAARRLNITPRYLRQIKDNFPHVKIGDQKQGRIMFYSKTLER